MKGAQEFDELIASIEADGMVLRHVELATEQVVFLKGLLEAYPSIAAVHAPPAAPGRVTDRRSAVMIATTPGFADELDGILSELSCELELQVREAR